MSQRTVATALALVCLASVAPAQTAKAKALSKEFDKLQTEYSQAQEKYYEPFNKAKTEEEMSKIHLDPAKNPDKVYGPRFVAFAKRAERYPTVFSKAGMMALRFTIDAHDRKSSDRLLDKLIATAVDSQEFRMGIYNLQGYTYAFVPEAKEKEKWLMSTYDKISAKAKSRAMKATVLGMKADYYAPAYGEMLDKSKGIALYAKLRDQFGDTDPGKRAVHALFRIQNLQVGQVAPDFTISDQNGIDWKLSDYRGKVVVLDFWGFW